MRVLVTGAAGFIGFHLSKALQKRGDFVLGLDNFNAYYDPSLKRERAHLLSELGIEVLEGEIQNTPFLKTLLARHKITHVAHLAAQAGVRHSITHPEAYVEANLHGFVSLLEACKAFPSLKFLYASSSSVYGNNPRVPFRVEDPTDHPVNLYGATKKANEVMAHAYHHLYGLSVTGLRFFTVYGPWGRPDMAYYRFASHILEEKPIQIFHRGKMRRDFTYIDDIIDGTLAALDLGAPCELFNLGHHQSIEVLTLLDTLEQALGKKAIREYLPLQPGEVLETYADIEKSQKLLGFRPKIGLQEGIGRFAEWFLHRRESAFSSTK